MTLKIIVSLQLGTRRIESESTFAALVWIDAKIKFGTGVLFYGLSQSFTSVYIFQPVGVHHL